MGEGGVSDIVKEAESYNNSYAGKHAKHSLIRTDKVVTLEDRVAILEKEVAILKERFPVPPSCKGFN